MTTSGQRLVAGGLVVATLTLTACSARSAAAGPSSTPAPAVGTSVPVTSVTPSDPTSSDPVPGTSATTAPVIAPKRVAAADRAIRSATTYLGHQGVSIEAVDLHTGRQFRYGAKGGMYSGSIAKLYIIETLLLQHQRKHTDLDDDDIDLATTMIENSDNDAANALDEQIGEGKGFRRAAKALGVRNTKPGPGIYWGFNQTCASDYIALLRNLTGPSALTRKSRTFVLKLMSKTESDQRWGVSAAADPGTLTRQKNGWLPLGLDDGRWLVNSTGIITADDHRVLIVVLTQHGNSFDGGIELTEKLARIAVQALES